MTPFNSRSRHPRGPDGFEYEVHDGSQDPLELSTIGSTHGNSFEDLNPSMHSVGPLSRDGPVVDEETLLDRRTVRKLDFVLLPFVSILFLLNSLDKSNIGNAETANFTRDTGLAPDDFNTAVAFFFAFFVALQPLGAALGRKFGMAIWVPSCMALWGVCTALHVWVHHRWQLILLRIAIGTLEAGFYPTTVSYLSLFYTRFEFARRLSIFYGQHALAGALGGLLSYAVFSQFPTRTGSESGWKSWQVLFVLEGTTTIFVALVGFFWLPHSAGKAWFLNGRERKWAETRVRRDRHQPSRRQAFPDAEEDELDGLVGSTFSRGSMEGAESLLASELAAPDKSSTNLTSDSGISWHDVRSAFTDWKIYYLLTVNILSSIPATAFSIFLPLITTPLANNPAHANLLTAPPFLIGATILFLFASWSDRHRLRIVPILYSLALLLTGLCAVVLLPADLHLLRYIALCLLLGGTFVASPLTVAWLADNIQEPGKRAVVLGINGWGNFAGVLAALLFRPEFAPAYIFSFAVTFLTVLVAFAGYAAFRSLLVRENQRRREIVARWDEDEIERERRFGNGILERHGAMSERNGLSAVLAKAPFAATVMSWIGDVGRVSVRRGDEKMTFIYGL